MEIITLTDSRTGACARFLPELGCNCFQLQLPIAERPVQILDAPPDFDQGEVSPRKGGIPILFPFPNRIRGAVYEWAGRTYSLDMSDTLGNAIHGLVLDRPWRVCEVTDNTLRAEFLLSREAPDRRASWPADFLLEVTWRLAGSCLRTEFRVHNPDRVPLPWGLGTHPYFRVPLAPDSTLADCLLQVPAAEYWELDACIPTGVRRPVSGSRDLRDGASLAGLQLDDVLTSLTIERGRGRSLIMDARAGWQVAVRADSLFRELVVFTPPHGRAVCIEPYTCPTDAIHLERHGHAVGWQVLPPGESRTLAIEIEAGLVLA